MAEPDESDVAALVAELDVIRVNPLRDRVAEAVRATATPLLQQVANAKGSPSSWSLDGRLGWLLDHGTREMAGENHKAAMLFFGIASELTTLGLLERMQQAGAHMFPKPLSGGTLKKRGYWMPFLEEVARAILAFTATSSDAKAGASAGAGYRESQDDEIAAIRTQTAALVAEENDTVLRQAFRLIEAVLVCEQIGHGVVVLNGARGTGKSSAAHALREGRLVLDGSSKASLDAGLRRYLLSRGASGELIGGALWDAFLTEYSADEGRRTILIDELESTAQVRDLLPISGVVPLVLISRWDELPSSPATTTLSMPVLGDDEVRSTLREILNITNTEISGPQLELLAGALGGHLGTVHQAGLFLAREEPIGIERLTDELAFRPVATLRALAAQYGEPAWIVEDRQRAVDVLSDDPEALAVLNMLVWSPVRLPSKALIRSCWLHRNSGARAWGELDAALFRLARLDLITVGNLVRFESELVESVLRDILSPGAPSEVLNWHDWLTSVSAEDGTARQLGDRRIRADVIAQQVLQEVLSEPLATTRFGQASLYGPPAISALVLSERETGKRHVVRAAYSAKDYFFRVNDGWRHAGTYGQRHIVGSVLFGINQAARFANRLAAWMEGTVTAEEAKAAREEAQGELREFLSRNREGVGDALDQMTKIGSLGSPGAR